jgi:glucose/arabinose dehydrogenase/mono/diheme cytochrome c family protein
VFPIASRRALAAALFLTLPVLAVEPVPDPAIRLKRGQTLFVAGCSMCHQVTGRGAAGSYPPLAGSDYLAGPTGRRDAIRAVVGGLQGRITVNGKVYENQMPAVVLDDSQVADVLTFVFNSWGNPGGSFEADEVAQVRSSTEFKTYAALVAANAYAPLPKAPEGTSIRELVRLNEFVVRMASDGAGKSLYLLTGDGGVRKLDLASRKVTPLMAASDYIDASRGGPGTAGLHLDSKRRLWIVCNQRRESEGPLVTNEVTVFRTTDWNSDRDPIRPKPWFRMQYPWGIGPYNHGVSHLATGPDGKVYLSSGSRTDGGETGSDPRLGSMGETDLTSALLRFDPESTDPRPEVVARGIRNAWSFNWDAAGNLFTVSNGPDAHACEEMDWIRPPQAGQVPRHHGFPYQFEDWPVSRAAYPHTPKAPEGLAIVHPVHNLGPDALPAGREGWTFQPHSSPAGLVWLDSRWPEPWRNRFVMGRFGNLITGEGGTDTGFDVLSVGLEKNADGSNWNARVHTFLAPLGRPLDLHLAGGKLYVLEYTRPTNFKDGRGWLPGRILEVTPGSPVSGR